MGGIWLDDIRKPTRQTVRAVVGGSVIFGEMTCNKACGMTLFLS